MNDLTIREATREDLLALGRLYERSGIDAAGANTPDTLEAAWARLRAATPQAQVLIAESQGEPVGTLTFVVLPMLAHGGTAAALVEAVAVDARAHGQGVGRALMDEAMARARTAGCYKLALSSNDKRESAHAFYTRLGYQRHGVSFVADLQEKAR